MSFYWSVNPWDAPLPGSPERSAGLGRQVWGSVLAVKRGPATPSLVYFSV